MVWEWMGWKLGSWSERDATIGWRGGGVSDALVGERLRDEGRGGGSGVKKRRIEVGQARHKSSRFVFFALFPALPIGRFSFASCLPLLLPPPLPLLRLRASPPLLLHLLFFLSHSLPLHLHTHSPSPLRLFLRFPLQFFATAHVCGW